VAPPPLDLSGIASVSAAFAARAHRDFKPLLVYLQGGGEIDQHIRAVLIEEVERLAKAPPNRRRPRRRLKAEAEHELGRIRAMLSESEPAAAYDHVFYDEFVRIAREAGVTGDLEEKGNLTEATKAILCRFWGIKRSALERILYPPKPKIGETSAKAGRRT
jgi:hypothetical protein